MTTGNKISLATTGLLVLAVGIVTGGFGLFFWALALNGFMGQEAAVSISMYSYFALAALSLVLCVVASVFVVYRLAVRRGWNSAGASALSVLIFSAIAGAAHFLCVLVSTIVASALRT